VRYLPGVFLCYDRHMTKKSLIGGFSVLISELIIGVMVIIICLSFLLTITQKYLTTFDKTIIQSVYSLRSDFLTGVMKTITFFGGELFLSCGIFLLLLVLWRRHKISALIFTFLLVFGTVINLFLKDIFHRPRPDYLPLVHEITYSFPSGHAMNSFIFYTCLAYFIIRNTKSRQVKIITAISAGSIIFLIGLSRVYLGAHFPSDVIAGYIAGLMWFIVILVAERTAHHFKLFKKVL
jgi:membrane-associated phospholipid phosphatase